ncbi:MAG: BrnA antitoxin family protein [Burkholderiales bacterium]
MRSRTIVSKLALRRTLGSDLKRVDAHVVKPHEYKELPELTEDMLARATLRKGGRPKSENPRQMISLRLPPNVIERWKATGPGWQTRMAERLAKGPATRAKHAA